MTSVAYGAEISSEQFVTGFARLRDNICHVVRGKTDVVDLVLTCFFAEGHLLIEDVPGVGKTTIARALAASLSGGWSRIQFTPDLLPSNVPACRSSTSERASSSSTGARSSPTWCSATRSTELRPGLSRPCSR